jgi:hypothetical protein
MLKINVAMLKAGMTLAAEVLNEDGHLLIPANVEVSQKHIGLLESWGVPDVHIQESGDGSTEEVRLSLEAIHRAETEVLPIFRHQNMEDATIQELMRISALRRARRGFPQPA